MAPQKVFGNYKTEMYQMYEITNEESLRFAITDYIRFYSEERPQDRYHCKTPLEVRMEALSSEHPAEYLIPRNKRIEKYKKMVCIENDRTFCTVVHQHLILDI